MVAAEEDTRRMWPGKALTPSCQVSRRAKSPTRSRIPLADTVLNHGLAVEERFRRRRDDEPARLVGNAIAGRCSALGQGRGPIHLLWNQTGNCKIEIL